MDRYMCDGVRLFLCSLTKGPLRALPRQLFPVGRSPHMTSRQVARLEERKNWHAVSELEPKFEPEPEGYI